MSFGLSVLAVLAAGGGSASDPGRTMEIFLRAVQRSDTSSALDLVSSDAYGMIDSLLDADPERLCWLADGFGVTIEPGDLAGMEPRGFLGAVLSSPALAGMLAMTSWHVSGSTVQGNEAIVSLDYRILGSNGSMQVLMVMEDGRWRLDDYFGGAPLR